MDLRAKEDALHRGLSSGRDLGTVFEGLLSFGPRFMGSVGERRAQEYLADRLRSFGLAVEFQSFPVRTYVRGDARATVSAGGAAVPLDTQAFVFCPPTDGVRTLELVDGRCGEAEDIAALGDAMRGRAVYCRPGDEMRSRRHMNLTEAGAAACVFGSHLKSHDGIIISHVRPTRVPSVPALGLNRSSSARLEEVMARGSARVSFEVTGEEVRSSSGNLVATLPGRDDLPEIVLGGHLDTYDLSEGAFDNGTGVAVIAELARLFASLPPTRRTVRFVFFTGEEISCTGSHRYVAERLPDPGKVGLFFNVDMPAEGGVPGILKTLWEEDPRWWDAAARDLGAFPVAATSARSSDHEAFVERGIPAIWTRAFPAAGAAAPAFEHTVLDTGERVDREELRRSAALTARLLLRLAECETLPFPPRPPGMRAA